jgi:hypothetical protein
MNSNQLLKPDELDVLFLSSLNKSAEIDLLEEQRDRLFKGLEGVMEILRDDTITSLTEMKFRLVQAIGRTLKKANEQ